MALKKISQYQLLTFEINMSTNVTINLLDLGNICKLF